MDTTLQFSDVTRDWAICFLHDCPHANACAIMSDSWRLTGETVPSHR